MAWEWNHSTEAVEHVRQNLMKKRRDWLAMCLAEWKAYEASEKSPFFDFKEEVFQKCYEDVMSSDVGEDCIAEDVFRQASEFRTCENGGHEAWVCPYGCHCVSFDLE